MSKPDDKWARRKLLRGAGGVALGLPMLDIFEPRRASAAPSNAPVYAAFLVTCDGVVQGVGRDPEMFWPRATGPLTKQSLEADNATRATGELAAHAEKLLMPRGIDHAFGGGVGCAHTSGNNQVLTAAMPVAGSCAPCSVATGESIDNRIAREKNPPGREPLVLHAGGSPPNGTGYGNPGNVSYRAPRQMRAMEPNPWNAYQRIIGLAAVDPAVGQKINLRRKSVNDVLRAQVKRLLARSDLTRGDRDRLDQHFTAIREIELTLTRDLPAETVTAMKGVNGAHHSQPNRDKIIKLQLDLMAFAFAADYTRVAVLKIGDNNDPMQWTIDGVRLPPDHWVSHRIMGDGNSGAPIADAVGLHHKIDRLKLKYYKYLLDRVGSHATPRGNLLDSGYYAFTNHVSTGAHTTSRIPWILAGSAGGYLKTGLFVDVGKVTSNKLLNTLLTASGVSKAGGAPVDDFGEPTLQKGIITEILA